MTMTSKIALSVMAASAMALTASASQIQGSVSFNGNVTAYVTAPLQGILTTILPTTTA
jgi:hypothetical protein